MRDRPQARPFVGTKQTSKSGDARPVSEILTASGREDIRVVVEVGHEVVLAVDAADKEWGAEEQGVVWVGEDAHDLEVDEADVLDEDGRGFAKDKRHLVEALDLALAGPGSFVRGFGTAVPIGMVFEIARG